jgi:predicted CopG family antitoxin
MSTSIRIQDDVYSCLEANTKGYESVSDTVNRSVSCLEQCEAFEMIDRQIELSIIMLNDEGIVREKVILMHYQKEAIEKAMLIVERLYPKYSIKYNIEINALYLFVEESSS